MKELEEFMLMEDPFDDSQETISDLRDHTTANPESDMINLNMGEQE